MANPAGDVADAVSLDELRERGRRRDAAELDARTDAVGPDDPFTFIYTSGTTGPPKGCVLTHGNYRSVLDMVQQRGLLNGDDDLVYLFLPLAHAFALLIQLGAFDTGTTIAFWGGDTKQIIPELMEVKPTYLPSVPRIFEKLYTLASGQLPAEEIKAIREVGGRVRDLEVRGEEVPADLQAQLGAAAAQGRLRARPLRRPAARGGHRRRADRARDPRVLLGLRHPGPRGLRDDGDLDGRDQLDARRSTASARSARPLPGVEVKIADDGEILLRGANIFRGYYKNDDASFGAVVDGWLHTGDVGRVDEDGYRLHHGPQEGHHHHRGRQEPDAGEPRERPQADALGLAGRHARRPPPVPRRCS